MDKVKIGKRIREERKKHHYTLDDLAEQVGVGKTYLSEVERGRKLPSLNVFCAIINAFEDVPADYILRDYVIPAQPLVLNEITKKLDKLPPHRISLISAVIDAMIANFSEDDAQTED